MISSAPQPLPVVEIVVDRTEQESNKSSEDADVKPKESADFGRMNLQKIIHRESVSDTERYNEDLENALDFYEDQEKGKRSEESPLKLRRSISRAYGDR